MVVVGPEDPLVEGIYDYVQNRPELKHIAVIGPSANGAPVSYTHLDVYKRQMLYTSESTSFHRGQAAARLSYSFTGRL